MLAVTAFVVALIVAVIIHELGHFVTAKWFGMKAERFFVGFGPTLWSTRRGETEYGLKAIPAGGFVKIVGMNRYEEVDEADRPRAFFNQPAWQRFVVLAAGSATHFVVAGILLFVIVATLPVPRLAGGEPVLTGIGMVMEDSPAERAGLEAGDAVLAVDGVPTGSADEIIEQVQARPGETFTLTVERDFSTLDVPVTLPATNPDGEERGFLGVALGAPAFARYDLGEATREATVGEYSLWSQTGMTLSGLASAFSPDSLANWVQQADPDAPRGTDGPISLIGAGQAVAALASLGELSAVLLLFVQINIVIGVLNMLPLPPFDGGHVAVLVIEQGVNGVRRLIGRSPDWQLSPSVVTPVALAVLVLVTGFVLTAFYIDIVNPVSRLFE
jgi:membrane-associated protease RseP (regulator of RpoE activity)